MTVTGNIREKVKLAQALRISGSDMSVEFDWDHLLPYFKQLEDFQRTERRKLPRPVCFLLGVVFTIGVLAPVIAHLVPK